MKNQLKSWVTFAAIFGGLLVFISPPATAQINIGGKPYSFQRNIEGAESIPMASMPSVNMDKIDKEDQKDNQAGLPPRFGYPFQVELNLKNSGAWTTLDNGDRIWRLNIAAPDALSINLTYDAFWLPNGATYYIYNGSRTQVIGGFTSRNNNSPKGKSIGFATGFIYGEQITLEYYEPKEVSGQGEISIDQVVHGYRTLHVPESPEAFGTSGTCQVNINCVPEGDNWQAVKNSVALIVVGGSRWCTGSLLITTVQDFKPYFLTANHCLDGWAIPTALDAVTNPMAGNWMFIWQYESAGCGNGVAEPTLTTTTGAIVMANNGDSDFALFRLIESPEQLTPAIPLWYNGWDATGATGTGGVGIHHPDGDLKKIATHNMTPVATDQGGSTIFGGNYWQVNWDATTNGQSVTEGGSSGSPLLDNSQRVIGQLFGGSAVNCSDPDNDPGRYGKFSVSWDGNGSGNSRRRLHDWLNPDCPVNQVISTSFNLGGHAFYVSNEISSTSNIAGNVLVDFNAGRQIRLLPDFTAEAGVFFSAQIRSCEPLPMGAIGTESRVANVGAGSYLLPGEGNNAMIALDRQPRQLAEGGFQCYPNPFSDGFYLDFEITKPTTLVSIMVTDAFGRQVDQPLDNKLLDEGTHSMKMSYEHLPPGIYYITLNTSVGRWAQKVVKGH